MKKKFQKQSNQDQSENLPKFLDLESKVFSVSADKKVIYIGKNKIDDVLRNLLRDEAISFQKSRLWEILNASAINEAYNLALLQSKNFEQVEFAKALKHWSFFMINVIYILSQNK